MNILDPHPILASFHGIILYTHGAFFALGTVVAFLVLHRYARLVRLPTKDLFFNVVMVFFLGIVGARIGYALVYPLEFRSFHEVIAVWEGGLLSYTGIMAGIAGLFFLYRSSSLEERRKWYDGAALAALIGWAIGRLGNYYTAESGGIASSFWSPFYGHIPIQLFESALCLALFTLLLIFRNKKEYAAGDLTLLALGGYALGRCIIDTWRDESVFLFLHLSQWASLGLLITVIVVWILKRK